MQRGSSVNFQPVKSAGLSVAHASREVAPEYLLPPDKSLGTIVLIDDRGRVASTLEAKMALASRQAKRQGDYSPLWEGVINLRSPEPGEDATQYKRICSGVVSKWCDEYQKTTGHTVLRADIHLDEGRLDIETGEVLFNAHAHVICDKTNALGRVIKLDAPALRKVQDLTSEITGLKRGENSLQTGRKHLGHQAYKYLAEKGRLETKNVKDKLVDEAAANVLLTSEADGLRVELSKVGTKHAKLQKLFSDDTPIITSLKAEVAALKAQIEADYKAARAAMVASKTATQANHQRLKKERDDALIEAAKVPQLEAKLADVTERHEAYQVKALSTLNNASAVANGLQEELKTSQEKVTQMDEFMTPDEKLGMAWWNNLQPAERGQWLAKAGTAVPADAWATFKAEEPTRTTPEPLSSPSLGKSPLSQEKTLKTRLSESWGAFVDWIKGSGGKQEQVTASSLHIGPVVQLDDFHAVQRTGKGQFAIHRLDDLDKIPALDNPRLEVQYRDGIGHVTGPGRAPKTR